MANEENNYDNGGWQNPDQSGTFDSAAGSSQTPGNGNYYDQSQNGNNYNDSNRNGYYDQPQNNNGYYNQPQNSNPNYYNSQPGDGFQQTKDSFNSVNNQGYQNYVPEPEEGPGYAIAGMVCGILSIVLCCCQYYISGALAVIGMIFSIIVLKGRKPGKGMAIAGVVCSAIGIIIALFLIITRLYMLTHPEYMNNLMDFYRQSLYSQIN
ncbi:MAG: hypothetical protein K2J67_00510 [Lachnospiraceae bacterium]|nr:hypothetical protein [Lachnospiraceae bacterium]